MTSSGRSGDADRLAAVRNGRGHTTVNRPPTAPPGPGSNYGETAIYRDREPCHVWVTTEAGRNPGLLAQWRKPQQLPWEGLVAHPRLQGGTWVLVREWFPAGAIEQA